MAQIAFILLCHKNPSSIIKQANRLTAAGDYMSIHFDARSKPEHYERIKRELSENANVTFARKRIKCGWGAWSLVQATLNAIEAALDAFPRATHFYMVSGDCMAIKSAEYTHAFLDGADVDYIESFDYFKSDWIKTGMKEERLIYRHFFNERSQKRRFYASFNIQKKLGLKRKIPHDIDVMIGSQWWCLRRRTIEWVVDFTRKRKDVMRFFKTTWIPDETFFQTIVRHVVPENEISCRTLTFLLFSDYGMPATFYNDHYDLLISQDYLFARKISPEAVELKRRLGNLYAEKGTEFQISNEGRSLFKFVTSRGRDGRRFSPRFWESEGSLGHDRELLVVVAKKWHVAKRLIYRIKDASDLHVIEYLFDEESCPMPDLGGIQSKLGKRARHRRALVRMMFEYYNCNRLLVCLDPKNIDLLKDFASDRSTTSVLEIESEFTDEYLLGHAKRVGLAGENTSQDTIDRLLPTIRSDVRFESDRLRDAGFSRFFRIRQAADSKKNIQQMAQFLSVPENEARDILALDHLFLD